MALAGAPRGGPPRGALLPPPWPRFSAPCAPVSWPRRPLATPFGPSPALRLVVRPGGRAGPRRAWAAAWRGRARLALRSRRGWSGRRRRAGPASRFPGAVFPLVVGGAGSLPWRCLAPGDAPRKRFLLASPAALAGGSPRCAALRPPPGAPPAGLAARCWRLVGAPLLGCSAACGPRRGLRRARRGASVVQRAVLLDTSPIRPEVEQKIPFILFHFPGEKRNKTDFLVHLSGLPGPGLLPSPPPWRPSCCSCGPLRSRISLHELITTPGACQLPVYLCIFITHRKRLPYLAGRRLPPWPFSTFRAATR